MNIFNQLKNDILNAVSHLELDSINAKNLSIEIPKNSSNGDIASNIAMILAAKVNLNPRIIASSLQAELAKNEYIEKIEIAGPGFMNFFIKPNFWQNSVKDILTENLKFKFIDIGANQKVNLEYVSVNPTGPIHVGHARGAVYGDVLASIMKACGYNVTKEFYVNDAGAQIGILVKSVLLRCREIVTLEKISFPEGFYPGSYLIPVAKELLMQNPGILNEDSEQQIIQARQFVIDQMMQMVKNDLKQLNITHEVFFSESTLHSSGKIAKIIADLKAKDLIYFGSIPAPKGQILENYELKEQFLFRSSNYGDSQDRPIQKNDGSWSYFAADIAYIQDKFERGFKKIIIVLGADHSGYIERLKAVGTALYGNQIEIEIRICQLVNFMEEGQPVKMSKRAGKFDTISDINELVGCDIIRFIMLTRKNDMILDFDLQNVMQQSKDNPIFYVQYGYVRTHSILNNAKESMPKSYRSLQERDIQLNLLSDSQELELIKLLAFWPRMLELSCLHYEPHRLAAYLISVVNQFHYLWSFSRANNQYRFIVSSDENLTAARLALVKAVQNVLKWGFDIIGTKVVEKM